MAFRPAALVAIALSCFGSIELGCASKKPAASPTLPAYGGEQAALFSDLFRPELFGMDGAQRPEQDALLPDRGQRADYIAPVRVVTVSRRSRSEFRSYTVIVEPTAAPLRGSLGQSSLALTVADGSPAFAWLEVAGERWVGTRLLLFLRNYQEGAHFFGTVDSAEVREAALPKPPPPPARAQTKSAP